MTVSGSENQPCDPLGAVVAATVMELSSDTGWAVGA